MELGFAGVREGPMIHSAPMEQQDLRKAGLKVTHPRMRILELLEQTRPRHMTAEDIYRQLLEHGDEIGLATVYRVLTQFEAAGLVLKHNFEGGHAVYELDRGEHHDHMSASSRPRHSASTSTQVDSWAISSMAARVRSPDLLSPFTAA